MPEDGRQKHENIQLDGNSDSADPDLHRCVPSDRRAVGSDRGRDVSGLADQLGMGAGTCRISASGRRERPSA